MEQLISYHGKQEIKDFYIARFAEHRKLDQVIQGTGYDNGRGCMIGCTLDAYDHSRFPIELGWPEWLARLADTIFEGLPKAEAPQFGTDLLASVPVGIDLERVRYLAALHRIDRLIGQQREKIGKHGGPINAVISGSISALEVVRRCHEAEIGGNTCDWSAARAAAESAESAAESAAWSAASWSAESAAESAAWSARSAAWSAARSAESWSAQSAAESAESAAESAWSAAWSAARSAAAAWSAAWSAYQSERDDLLDILRTL